MPHANPIPAIAYASLTGSADVSSAAPSSHAKHVPSSPIPPFNKQQTTSNSPSSAPRSALHTPSFDFRAPHFTLFLQVLHIASTVIVAIAQRMDSDLHCLTLLQGCEAINCLYSIIRIQLTIDRHPERITPAELRRLAKASRYINRLARQKLDFSLFSTDDNPQSTANEQQTTNNKPSANPQSPSPFSALRAPRLTGLRSTPVCHSPGATLARTCQSLCRILKLLPDLAYDPSGTVATLDLANPASFSPSTLLPGARASSPASTPTPANPATLSPKIPTPPFNIEHLTLNVSPSPHSEFLIPHFIPAPT